VTFSETITGVDASDFSLVQTGGVSGASITGVTPVSGTVYTVTASTGSGNGTLGLNLVDNDSIIDAASNPLGGTGAGNGNYSGQTYNMVRPVSVTASPTACVNDASIGTQAWGTLTGPLASDDSWATATVINSEITNYLKCTGYNFAIPAGATITGIEVAVEDHSARTINDYAVQLVKAGAIQTTNYATNTRFPGSDAYTTYGGGTDLWGNTWIAADINSANFGVAFAAQRGGYSSNDTAYVDHMPITVTYTVPPAAAVLSINRADPSPTSAATVSWTVTFSSSVTGVDATVFSLVPTGLSGAFITSVTGSGTTWTVAANTGIGAGTLGLDQTGPGSVSPTLSGTFTGQVYTVSATPALAEYRMDEASWNGTANEAVDSGTGGFNGTAAGLATLPTTSNTSPVPISGNPGTCRYGVFNRSNKDYIALPGSFPDLAAAAGDFTITAWINVANSALPGQRILIDDENNSSPGGWGFSVGETTTYGAGGLRFYYRQPSVYILDTVPIPSNQWLFVALSVQLVAGANASTATIYAWDTAGTLVTTLTGTFTWTAGSDPGPSSIGGETNAAGENTNAFGFGGNLDELRVYQKVLSQSALTAIAAQTHPCPISVPDHLVIQSSGSGVTCTPSTLTVTACQDAACATPFTLGVSGTLSATGAGMTVNWDGTTGGAAGAGFVIPSGLSSVNKKVQVTTAGSVLLGISAPNPIPVTATICNFGSPNCTFTSALAGFVVSAPNHVSCTSQTLTVKAVKQSDTSVACVPAFASTSKTTTISFAYVNPTPPSGTRTPWVGGTAISTSGTSKSLTFDANGIATPSFVYDDVGQIGITVGYSGPVGTEEADLSMIGTTSPNPIIAPASFAFSGITAAPITAGANFNATVTAMNACATPTATPNFGKETSAEGVTLSFTRTSPAGTNNPVTGPSDGSFSGSVGAFGCGGSCAQGSAMGSNLIWSEVGQGTLTATLASGNYLSSGLTASGSTASGAVGRFKPAYFDTAVTVPGCNTFTYSGQPFTVTVTANKQGGGTTVNYSGSLSPVFANAVTLSDANGGTGTWANNSLATSDFVAGAGTKSTVSYTFASRQTTPTAIAVRAIETAGDGVSSSGHTEEITTIYSGRARLLNANGSEILDLPVPFRVEYWKDNISGWTVNSSDTCTGNINTVSLLLSTPPSSCVQDTGSPGSSGSGCAVAGPAAKQFKNAGANSGDFNLWLKAPGLNDTGSVTITSTVPAWLQYPWLSSTPTSPVARATFGVIKSGPVIYRREMY
ncbi:MAG: DUF6701 domain-containing protein, partial [Georgfuchsia sp.]